MSASRWPILGSNLWLNQQRQKLGRNSSNPSYIYQPIQGKYLCNFISFVSSERHLTAGVIIIELKSAKTKHTETQRPGRYRSKRQSKAKKQKKRLDSYIHPSRINVATRIFFFFSSCFRFICHSAFRFHLRLSSTKLGYLLRWLYLVAQSQSPSQSPPGLNNFLLLFHSFAYFLFRSICSIHTFMSKQ